MWYYNVNNQPVGPVSDESLLYLYQSGSINTETLVWSEGLANWVKLAQTGLLAAAQPVTPAWQKLRQSQTPSPYSPQTPDQVTNQPYQPVPTNQVQQAFQTPGYKPIPDYLRIKPSSISGIFIAWIVLTGIIFLYTRLSIYFSNLGNITLVSGIQALLSLTSFVLMLVFLGKCWGVVQDGQASATVRQAIGYLFIPFFNFYWLFRAYHGLSGDLNRFIDRHFDVSKGPQPRKSTPAVSLIYCILLLMNLVKSVVIQIMMINGTFRDVAMSIGYTVFNQTFSIIFTAITIWMCVDYLVTTRRILENVQK